MPRWILPLLALALLGWLSSGPSAISQAPGVLVPEAPRQIDLDQAAPINHGEFELSPRAEYALRARVLSRRVYRWDAGAALSPLDLALGWGPMSDSTVLDRLRISQSGRWFTWRADELPIPQREIEVAAANVHLIPADRTVERQLKRLPAGAVVRLEGLLVDAYRSRDGFTWRSSLTREDTGAGACELMYVRSVERL